MEMSMDAPPAGIPDEHVRMTKGPRRNSCEARPGLIESSHLAPLNEGLMAPDRECHPERPWVLKGADGVDKKKTSTQTIRMKI